MTSVIYVNSSSDSEEEVKALMTAPTISWCRKVQLYF